ncbi:MAG: threonylcarbamoyl-AMP synthase [Betaproteobacteria bacterium]|nr:threonylcarbamoyl-AMP synthase [Betaproteobacteria bacterium]
MADGRIAPATPETIARAAALLRAGRLVAFPTETVYGLGADAANADAVRAIFAAKGRPADHPLIVHLPDAALLAHWARAVPAGARRLADAFWPGPLTLILPRTAHAADVVTGGQDSVGLRVPSHPVARALLSAFAAAGGTGVAAPSANRFGRISPTTPQHVADDLADRVALIVDGGASDVGIESTIVAFAGDRATLLRPGGVAAADIERVLGEPLAAVGADAPRASGTLASHYAPHTPARLVVGAELASALGALPAPVAVLARTVDRPAAFGGAWIAAPTDPARYAHDLYANLRALDASRAAAIAIEAVPDDAAWRAVRDRLERATRGDTDDRD